MVSGKSYDWPAEPNFLPDICIEQIHILYKRMEALTGTIPVRKVTSVSYGLEISHRICGILAYKSGLGPGMASNYFMLSLENQSSTHWVP